MIIATFTLTILSHLRAYGVHVTRNESAVHAFFVLQSGLLWPAVSHSFVSKSNGTVGFASPLLGIRDAEPSFHVRPVLLQRSEEQLLVDSNSWANFLYKAIVKPARSFRRYGQRYLFQLFPASSKPKPYSTTQNDYVCRVQLRCTPNHPTRGVGREGCLFLKWVVALLTPCAAAFLVVVGVSFNAGKEVKNVDSSFEVKPNLIFVSLLGTIISFVSIGWLSVQFIKQRTMRDMDGQVKTPTSQEDSPTLRTLNYLHVVYPFFMLLAIVCMIASIRFGNAEFVRPKFHRSPFMNVLSIFRAVIYIYLAYLTAVWIHLPQYCPCRRSVADIGVNLWLAASLAYMPPNMGTWMFLYLISREQIIKFYYWGDTTGIADGAFEAYQFPTFSVWVFSGYLNLFTAYQRDRTFLVVTAYCAQAAIQLGQYLRSDKLEIRCISLRVIVLIVLAVSSALLMRFQRVLPPQLRKAKYVRLGMLCEMLREGRVIKRCQDMPDEAFGNTAKAMVLIIISHRWLDRYTCDVETRSCPQGLRLTTMCQRLEAFFPSDFRGCSFGLNPFRAIYIALRSALYQDYDVLIFFDFMALPQIGRLSDGTLLKRTTEEQQLFEYVLPAMGALYTMYDVLVCPEVNENTVPYTSSGWCFCELMEASLQGKLKTYSGDMELPDDVQHLISITESINDDHGQSFMEVFECRLKEKRFFFEGDRDTVRSIVKGSTVSRMLVHAVVEQDEDRVQTLLQQLSDLNMKEAINYAIDDDTLDTLLHVAMRLRSTTIIATLIKFGADIDCRNFRGDTPAQLFAVPRRWLLL